MMKAPINMQATAMVLMKILPDWNSLDSVRHVHSVLEFAALIFFGVLVVFDVLAHKEEDRKRERIFEQIGLWFFGIAVLCELVAYPYGQRNDDLSGREIISLDSKAQDAKDAAGGAKTIADSAKATAGTAAALSKTAHDESAAAVTTAGKANTLATGARNEADSYKADIVSAKTGAADAVSRLADAEKRLADSTEREVADERELAALRESLADRTLTDAQVATIAGKLRRFAPQEFTITAYWDSPESLSIANRIYGSLLAAQWKYNDEGQKGMLLGGVIGANIYLHPSADPATQTAADLLVKALSSEGLVCRKEFQNPTNNPKHNKISIIVGSKR